MVYRDASDNLEDLATAAQNMRWEEAQELGAVWEDMGFVGPVTPYDFIQWLVCWGRDYLDGLKEADEGEG